MKASTIVILLLLALALAFYGWKAVGWIAVVVLLIPVLLILLGIVAVLVLRAKIKRDVRRFLGAFGRAVRAPRADERMGSGPAGPGRPATGPHDARPGVIDVEARDATSTPIGHEHRRGRNEPR